jgi:hypothetical protein
MAGAGEGESVEFEHDSIGIPEKAMTARASRAVTSAPRVCRADNSSFSVLASRPPDFLSLQKTSRSRR